MQLKRVLILMLSSLSFVCSVRAQVTIGANLQPEYGSLLDLKEQDDEGVNATKGFLYPRVALEKNDELYPMYKSDDTDYGVNKEAIKRMHTGLVVYNVTDNDEASSSKDIFEPGLFVWDGHYWLKLNSALVQKEVEPQISELKCGSATLSPNSYKVGVAYKGILAVPYSGGNGAVYGKVDSTLQINGLKAVLQAGTLANGAGVLYYDVTGTPTVSSPTLTEFPVNFAGASCSVSVGNDAEVKTMEYMKATISPLPVPASPPTMGTTDILSDAVQMGNLIIKYYAWRSWYGGSGEEIRFASTKDNNVTFVYTKHGSGGVNFAYYGQKALKANVLLAMSTADNISSSSSDAYNISSTKRDYAVLLITFHNTKEIYRVSFNINGAIASSNGVAAVPSALTIFIERLE